MFTQTSLSSSAPALSTQNAKPEIVRRSAGFHPSIWGDQFLSYASNPVVENEEEKREHDLLKGKLKEKLMTAAENKSLIEDKETLDLIDLIQRLCVSYHFEKEISRILEQIMQLVTHNDHDHNHDDGDLYTTSLRFRLLRQNGYRIPCGVFNKFKDSEGNFKESLICDVKGMLSLYEAAHLRIQGEDILDEALSFTSTQLGAAKTTITTTNPSLAAQVAHALKQPIRKGLPRLQARRFMPVYEADPCHDKTLLTFAKLDFNMLQRLHQKEVGEITKWWKDIDFSNKMPFARDRVVECYFWTLGVYFEPKYTLGRKIFNKVIAMTSVLDDIYDVYGTLDELEIFTEAILRWDINTISQLPSYMQIYYQAFIDVYSEMEAQMEVEDKLYCVPYAKEVMKKLVRAYHQESKWFHANYVPPMEEYMSVALVSSGYEVLAATSFVGMGDVVTKDSFEWLFNYPKIITASLIMGRLMNDIVGHKFEQKRGHVASAVECYVKQYGGTEEEAVEEFRKQITNAWKDINEECLCPTAVPMPLLTRVLNLARVLEVIYNIDDCYTNSKLIVKDIASLLINPVP
uniref:(+)-delta-cadinene synthase n=1 Tax=Cistus creticus subsp. creticus TaxID=483148 RepID=B4YYR2_CISCR|nr:germacrene B synthase [Cistus creticus subsp. creticus]